MNETIIIVGYVGGAVDAFDGLQPEGSVVWVEEPDVVRKRGARVELDHSPFVRALVEWEHYLPGKADEFYLRHRDLDPVAVIPLTEYATPFAARLAERYRLPGAGFAAAQILRDKALLRQVSAAAGVANPESVRVENPAQVRAFMQRLGGPIVLKPANRQAAVGTQIIHDAGDVEDAWEACIRQDEGPRVPDRPIELRMLAERYVAGTEYSCEMLVRAGTRVWANVSGKQLFAGDRPVESGHVVPADIPDTCLAQAGCTVIANLPMKIDVGGAADQVRQARLHLVAGTTLSGQLAQAGTLTQKQNLSVGETKAFDIYQGGGTLTLACGPALPAAPACRVELSH